MKRWIGTAVLVVHLGGLQAVGLAAEEPFYKQATRAVFRLQIHRSVCTAGKISSQEILQSVGTGFFVQDFVGQELVLWAITARHVIAASDADLLAKVRLGAEGPKDVWLRLPREKWYLLQDGSRADVFPTDVAVMPLRRVDGYKSFTLCEGDKCPMQEAPKTGRIDNQLRDDPSVPDPILLLGFPQEGPDINALEPFARAGIVAYASEDAQLRIENKLMLDRRAYIIDAFGWPGNSGGPVMNQPLPLSGSLRLLGLVTGTRLPSADYSIVTPTSSILRTLTAARGAGLSPVDAWLTSYKPDSRDCASFQKK